MQPDEQKETKNKVADILNERMNSVEEALPAEPTKPADLDVVRTYSNDMANALKHQSESVVSIAAKEVAAKTSFNGKKNVPEVLTEKAARSTRVKFIVAGITLVLISVAASVLVYLKNANNTIPAQTGNTLTNSDTNGNVVPPHTPLIGVNETRNFDATGKNGADMLNAIAALKTEALPAGTVVEFFPNIPAQNLFRMLGLYPPMNTITDALVGVEYAQDHANPFIVIRGESRESLFAGLLAWEKTLPSQAKLFFGTSATGTNFTDLLIENRDARVQEGEEFDHIVYAFLNQTTVVIATNEATIIELLGKELRVDRE